MARKSPRKKQPDDLRPEERPEFLTLVAELAAVDPACFPGMARQCAEKYHDAVLAGHVEVIAQMEMAYTALVFKANGDTLFGCCADDDSSANVLERALAAKPGQVPGWGQSGEFLLEVEGMRIRVEIESNMLGNYRSCELHAVDFEQPFLSCTGYRNTAVSVSASLGTTVDQAMRRVVLGLLMGDGRPGPIEPEYSSVRASEPVPGWLAGALASVGADGQFAMFADPPPAPVRVPKSAAQRQKELRERRKEKQLKPVMLSEVERDLLEKIRVQFEGAPGIGGTAAISGMLGRALDFSMLDVGDADLLAVWKSLRSDFTRAATALGVLRLRNAQHAELGRAVAVLQARLREAGLDDRVTNSKEQWYWNRHQSPFCDYRAMSPPECMERQCLQPTVSDELASAKNELEQVKRECELLESERNTAFQSHAVLTERLRRAGLNTDYRRQPGE